MIKGLRIGTGIDVHGFEAGRKLMVGGIEIPHDRGLAGHSDADVLLHAINDAILGAAGMGDIGLHFPSSDPQWKNRPSADFLTWTLKEIRARGFEIISIVIAQEPMFRPHISKIEQRLREILNLEAGQVHVKATTTDHLGFVGRKEGIAAQAVALLHKQA